MSEFLSVCIPVRGAKLQARFNKLQAEAAKKQEQSAVQLTELQQKLDGALAKGQGTSSAALQDSLNRVSASAGTALQHVLALDGFGRIHSVGN